MNKCEWRSRRTNEWIRRHQTSEWALTLNWEPASMTADVWKSVVSPTFYFWSSPGESALGQCSKWELFMCWGWEWRQKKALLNSAAPQSCFCSIQTIISCLSELPAGSVKHERDGVLLLVEMLERIALPVWTPDQLASRFSGWRHGDCTSPRQEEGWCRFKVGS